MKIRSEWNERIQNTAEDNLHLTKISQQQYLWDYSVKCLVVELVLTCVMATLHVSIVIADGVKVIGVLIGGIHRSSSRSPRHPSAIRFPRSLASVQRQRRDACICDMLTHVEPSYWKRHQSVQLCSLWCILQAKIDNRHSCPWHTMYTEM